MPRAEIIEHDEGRIEEVRIPGVPSGTIYVTYDPEDRAQLEVSVYTADDEDDMIVMSTTVDLPHDKDLPDCIAQGEYDGT